MPDHPPTIITYQRSLWGELVVGGIGGLLVFALVAVVLLAGMVLLFGPATSRIRRVYLLAPLLPLALSLAVATLGMISAFSVLGTSGVGDSSALFAALGEISFPVQCAIFGAALAYTLAALAFLRPPRPPAG